MAVRPALASHLGDPIHLLRWALERRHLDPNRPLVATGDLPEARKLVFHELVEVAIGDPAALQRSIVELLGALHAARVELVFWIHGDRRTLQLRFGVVHKQGVHASHVDLLLRRGLEGHLLGSKFESVDVFDNSRSVDVVLKHHERCGAILGIPGKGRQEDPVPTLDGALEALSGIKFDLIIQCSPVGVEVLDVAKSNLALIAGNAHMLARQNFSSADAQSFSEAVSSGYSIAEGTSETVSWSTTITNSTSEVTQGPGEKAVGALAGMTLGAVLGGVAGFFTGGPMGAFNWAQAGARGGGVLGGALADSAYPTKTKSESTSTQNGGSTTHSATTTRTENSTNTFGSQFTRQLSLEVVNRQAGLMEEVAERHLERMRVGQGTGMWNTAAHLATADDATLQVAGHLLLGALRGEESHLEPLRLVPYTPDSAQTALNALRRGAVPRVRASAHPVVPGAEQPATLLTAEELGRWLSIPSHDLPGTPAREVVYFGRGGRLLQADEESAIPLGPLVYGGRESSTERLAIPTRDLCGHAFVAGTTGAGKTTTIREILRGLTIGKVPFLVLEPAKSEYLDLFEELRKGGHRPLRLELAPSEVSEDVRPLRLNPFAAPPGLPLGRHVEALKILLRSCFEMQESLPQLLERVLFSVYADRGWKDLAAPVTCEQVAARGFPTFEDFFEKVPSRRTTPWTRIEREVAAFGYENRVEKNLVAALSVRLESFRRGLKGQVLVADEVAIPALLKRPCFINLADINEPDIRRFLLSSLFLRLHAERAAEARSRPPAEGLRHLVVLEEAHHFLRRAANKGPSGELVQQSNMLLADAFAEFRAYGQGLLVADQAPGDLDEAVLRNTNVKVVHRLFQEADVAAMAEAIGLSAERRGELRRLGPGECVLFTPSLQQAAMCRVAAKE